MTIFQMNGPRYDPWGIPFFTSRNKKNFQLAKNPPESITAINITEIENAFKSFRRNGAPGLDKIPLCIWKIIFKERPTILLSLFNDILLSQVFPQSWKNSRVILIHKEGKDPNVLRSYRPICLLPTISKVFERVLLNRLNFYLDDKLNTAQYGFRSQRSTTIPLENLFNYHQKTKKEKLVYGILFIDIQKAFDDFDIGLCLQELSYLDCPIYLISILETFLSNREIWLNDFKIINNNGTPQGSCLSPFIWNIVMNAFLRKLPSSYWYLAQAYADDLVIFIRGRDEEHLQLNLNQISIFCGNWSKDAGITFSFEKCEFLTNQEKHPNLFITLNGIHVKKVTSSKYLGIHINYCFTPTLHLEKLKQGFLF